MSIKSFAAKINSKSAINVALGAVTGGALSFAAFNLGYKAGADAVSKRDIQLVDQMLAEADKATIVCDKTVVASCDPEKARLLTVTQVLATLKK